MREVDARLLRRLESVNDAMAPVLLVLLDGGDNDLDGGLPPAAELRSLGEDFRALGCDLISRADEVDHIVQSRPDPDSPGAG